MYQDASYGQNWQPRTNNARRIDPYMRSIKALGILFSIGFVLIVIVVLSLIPLYISQNSSTANNAQVPKISISNYKLHFQSPTDNFNPQTIVSDSDNRRTLQAALTSMLQTDSTLAGSIVEIVTPSKRRRRQASRSLGITFALNVVSGKGCSSVSCLNQFHYRTVGCLTDINQTTSTVRYQKPNSTEVYWLNYKLPERVQSNSTFVIVDTKLTSSVLDALLQVDRSLNQPISSTYPSTTVV